MNDIGLEIVHVFSNVEDSLRGEAESLVEVVDAHPGACQLILHHVVEKIAVDAEHANVKTLLID